jgi:hypothetical protein
VPHLSEGARRAELADGRRAVRELPGACDSFAYPFGDADGPTRQDAKAAGFATIMEVGGYSRALEPTRVARVPVAARTPAELFAEVEVVAPLKGMLKRLVER